ncbi:ParB N-terminal domain-containing protein [Streptomyces sp. NPDC102441]|uniref:ParB N-terminal domain-containing protein n=1 Tax=Streptomyces sp. NPDC102441 TaxID=3366176 RepID=UPI0037FC55FD
MELCPGEHVRAGGIDQDHVRVLTDCDEELPPIVVQRKTMRVIDGMHRLSAALACGRKEIEVRLVDMSDAEAFLYGVEANIAHGLPLTLSDRRFAARQVMALYPEWSDRAVGRASGLSGKTVSQLRDRTASDAPGSQVRIGLDGRARPLDSAARRSAARELITARPEASLREIARQAGISPGTVRRIRGDMEKTPSGPPASAALTRVCTARVPGPSPVPAQEAPSAPASVNVDTALANLRQDPSLKYQANGRGLLRLLHQRPARILSPDVLEAIPAHCVPVVLGVVRAYAQEWRDLEDALDKVAKEQPEAVQPRS